MHNVDWINEHTVQFKGITVNSICEFVYNSLPAGIARLSRSLQSTHSRADTVQSVTVKSSHGIYVLSINKHIFSLLRVSNNVQRLSLFIVYVDSEAGSLATTHVQRDSMHAAYRRPHGGDELTVWLTIDIACVSESINQSCTEDFK